jgi:hypothetical protein
MYACCSCEWVIRSNLCKHQIAIKLLTIGILESTLLEFCGTYFGSQSRFGCFIYYLPSMDDLILASDDDGNNDDDDDKDGEVQLHVDVGGCS